MKRNYHGTDPIPSVAPIALGSVVVLAIVGGIGWWIYGEVTEPDSGTITEMEHEEGYYEMDCVSYDYCVNEWNPPTWCLWYEDAAGEEGDACVKEELYNALKVGDDYFKGMKVSDAA